MSAQCVFQFHPSNASSGESALSLKDLMSLCTDTGVQAYLIACARAHLCAMNTIDRGGGEGEGGLRGRAGGGEDESAKFKAFAFI